MDPRHHLPLMFAVLDSEATPEEVRELERLIAIDAGARAEYEAQRRFFARLQRVFLLDPPSGLPMPPRSASNLSTCQRRGKP